MILSKLVSDDAEIVKACCISAAAIATEEVQVSQWEDFLQVMSNAATADQSNLKFKFAAIQTLQFYCDFSSTKGLEMTQPQVQQLLHATVSNIQSSDLRISNMALKALTEIVPFCEENFKVPEQRQYIMKEVLAALTSVDDEDVKLKALQFLYEVIFVGYDHLSDYIVQIGTVTGQFI
jgi:hypothetical protein